MPVARLTRLPGRLGRARGRHRREIRLCRIEYLGDDDWGFALYDPATETYERRCRRTAPSPARTRHAGPGCRGTRRRY